MTGSVLPFPNIVELFDLKQKLHVYLNSYGCGKKKPYDAEMDRAFNELFHDQFVHGMDGERSLDKRQMREIVKMFMSAGTAADVVLFKPLEEELTFEVKLHITNKLGEWHTHSRGTIRDGQLIRLEAYDEEAKDTYRKWQVLSELYSKVQGMRA